MSELAWTTEEIAMLVSIAAQLDIDEGRSSPQAVAVIAKARYHVALDQADQAEEQTS